MTDSWHAYVPGEVLRLLLLFFFLNVSSQMLLFIALLGIFKDFDSGRIALGS